MPPCSAHPHHIPVRRFAKQPFILPAELRRALIADSQASAGGILAFREHEALGFVQAQPFVELQRAERRHLFKMAVERGGGHVYLLSQLVDLQRFPIVVAQPCDGLGDLIALGAEGVQPPQEFPLGADEQAVMDFADDERPQYGDLLRFFEEGDEAQERIQDVGIDVRNGEPLIGAGSGRAGRRDLSRSRHSARKGRSGLASVT